jgi:predicted GNAT family acetyltransferase
MSSKSTSSEVGKRQRFDELQEAEETVLPYCELLEYYTETVRGIYFGETVADEIQISSYILTYAAQTSTIPVITVRLKEDCKDKGYGTYLVQDKLLFTLKEHEIPSKILLKLQETQPNVAAIGINNSIREYRCPEWLSVRSPKGVVLFSKTLFLNFLL